MTTPVSVDAVRAFILERYEDELEQKGFAQEDVGDDFDLFNEGIIDSLGVVETVGAVEEHFDMELDLDELDEEDMTILGPLCRFVEAQSRLGGN